MPISLLQPLPVGNAIRVFVAPPTGSVEWRILRNQTGLFPSPTDPASSVIHAGNERVVLDSSALINGQTYHYGLFVFDGLAWRFDGTKTVVPLAVFQQFGTDVLSVVRDRLDLGLSALVAKGELYHPSGHIQVLTAPPAFEDAQWPLVTVHLQQDASAERGIGEMVSPGEFHPSAYLWDSFEGWLSRVQLMIVGWCLNPDERIALRAAIKNVLIANLGVFDAHGMVQIDVSQSDSEDFQSYNAPVYQSMTTFSCHAPSLVNAEEPAIRSVTVDQVL